MCLCVCDGDHGDMVGGQVRERRSTFVNSRMLPIVTILLIHPNSNMILNQFTYKLDLSYYLLN